MHSIPQALTLGRRTDKGAGGSAQETQSLQRPPEGGDFRSPSLTFVTFSSPEEVKGLRPRFLIRSQALKDYHWKLKQQRQGAELHPKKSKSQVTRYQKTQARDQTSLVHNEVNDSPRELLGAGRVDPFRSLPRVVNHYEHLVFDYYITCYCAQNDPIYPPEFSNALSAIWLPKALNDVGVLNGMLLVGARNLVKIAPSKELNRLILQLRGRVIRDVNEAVSDEQRAIKDESIATVLQLAFDEMSTGNSKALKTHANALRAILKSRGKLESTTFQRFLGFLISRVILIAAQNKPKAPSPLSESTVRDAISVENLRPGFLVKEVFANLSAEIITVLDNFCALTEFAAQNPATATLPVGSFQIEAAFSDDETELFRLFNRNGPDIEQCMISAAGIYRSKILLGKDDLIIHFPLAPLQVGQFMDQFMAGIMRIYQSNRQIQYLEMLLWMVFLGSMSDNNAARCSFWRQMRLDLAQELNIVQWEDARNILKRFLWLDRRCEIPGRALWNQV